MKRFWDSYKFVLQDYFYDFFRGSVLNSFPYIMFLAVFVNWKMFDRTGVWAGMPILFALISGVTHPMTMPFPMYLAPFSHSQREEYLQKSLHIKIAAPICFAFIWDAALLAGRAISPYVFILQMFGVIEIALCCGSLHDSGLKGTVWKYAYGGLAPFTEAAHVLCYLEGMALMIACMSTVSTVEFWILLGIVFFLTAPVLNGIRKHWKEIRANFAEYEIATKTKEVGQR